jgi:hypothetical protein
MAQALVLVGLFHAVLWTMVALLTAMEPPRSKVRARSATVTQLSTLRRPLGPDDEDLPLAG